MVWTISGTGTKDNLVEGNFIGTDQAGGEGVAGLPNIIGVRIGPGASENVIGGTHAGAGNLISGNISGITITGTDTTANRVEGNLIGTDLNGAAPLANSFGVVISGRASGNVIGGTAPGARNIISGNSVDGIHIIDAGTTGNLVEGNFIGTNQDGSGPLSNLMGVQISGGATANVIGGTDDGAANVISGNTSSDGGDGGGIEISDIGTTGNLVEGNFIGTNPDGSAAVANRVGVSIGSGASANVIGGTAPRRGTSSPAITPAASSSPTRARRLTWCKAT